MSHFTQVVRYANLVSFPAVGDSSRVYIADDSLRPYIWNGSAYEPLASAGDIQTLWGYQDFPAGTITGTSVTLTTNQNGTGAEFTPANFYNYAEIYRSDGTDWVYTAGFAGLFQGLVDVTNESGTSITLNKIPNSATDCRIWWLYQGLRPETGYILPPENVLNSAATIKLDELFQTKITSPVNGDIVTTDANGQGQDSGKKFNDSGTTTNDIWSANKIQGLLDTKAGAILNEPHGFYDLTEFSLSWSNATRTITITRTGSSFSFYVNNVKVTKNSDDLKQISNTEGLHFVYYDLNGALQDTTTWSDDIILKYVPVCFVYWDATNGVAIPDAQIETHTDNWDGNQHLQQHLTVGTRYQSGLALSVNADGDGSNNNQIEVAGALGTIWDEDLQHSISSRALTDNIPVLYRSGASGLWRMDATLPYIVRTTGTGRAAYNQYTGGAWQLTEIGNNNFGLAYVYVCPSITNKWIVVMGQDTYGSVSAARTAAATPPSLGALPLQEFKLVGAIIIQTSNSYTNTPKSRIRTIDGTNPYVDWRTTNASANSATVNNSDIVYLQSQIDLKQNLSDKNAASGYAGLDASYKIISKSSDGVKTGYVSTATDASDGNNVYLPRNRSNGEIFCQEDYNDRKDAASGFPSLDSSYGVKVLNTSGANPAYIRNNNTTSGNRIILPIDEDNAYLASQSWVNSNYQNLSGKDASGGYAGLTLFRINFRNVANTFTSFFTNSNTAARTYTFQDRNGTIADNTDLAGKEPTITAGTTAQYWRGDKSWQTLNATAVGLGSVTNDAQTKAAIVPNTTPSAGQILVGNAGGTAYAPVSVSGDATLASTGALTVTKTNGTSFAASATTDTTNAGNISSGTLAAARLPNPSASTLGGIQSLASSTSKWINAISTSGVPSATQPAFSDITGIIASSQINTFRTIYSALSTAQERADTTDISWTSATTYSGLGSDITLSGNNITFASGYKYLIIGTMSATLDTDPAYLLSYQFRINSGNVGLIGYLNSNPSGSTSDKGIGGQSWAVYVVDATGGSISVTFRKISSGAGSSTPTVQAHFIAFTLP